MNKIQDKTNEVEQVRQQLNHSLMEYDKLLERFEKVEAELKCSKAENEKLERQKNFLRTSNDNLNKELDTMNELRNVFKSNTSIVDFTLTTQFVLLSPQSPYQHHAKSRFS